MYFGTFPNSNTRKRAIEVQKDRYVLAKNVTVPAVNTTLEIIGYGTTQRPYRSKSQVQQVHSGPFTNDVKQVGNRWSLEYRVDTTGGNSGSAVVNVQTGEAIAVHAYAGCYSYEEDSSNSGTFLGQIGLQKALANPKGVCSRR